VGVTGIAFRKYDITSATTCTVPHIILRQLKELKRTAVGAVRAAEHAVLSKRVMMINLEVGGLLEVVR